MRKQDPCRAAQRLTLPRLMHPVTWDWGGERGRESENGAVEGFFSKHFPLILCLFKNPFLFLSRHEKKKKKAFEYAKDPFSSLF